jgi:hypothetical protein
MYLTLLKHWAPKGNIRSSTQIIEYFWVLYLYTLLH